VELQFHFLARDSIWHMLSELYAIVHLSVTRVDQSTKTVKLG